MIKTDVPRLVITSISKGDTEAVLKVYRDAIHAISYSEYDAATLTELASRTSEEFERLALTRLRFVAKIDGEIVGYAGLDKHEGRLTECYVSPEHSGKHIGSKLVEAVETEVLESELRNVTVLSALNAVGFYKKNGFEEKEISYLPMSHGMKMRCMLLQKELFEGV